MQSMETDMSVDLSKNKEIVDKMNDIFGQLLDAEVIEMVAFSCDYDVKSTYDALYEMAQQANTEANRPQFAKENMSQFAEADRPQFEEATNGLWKRPSEGFIVKQSLQTNDRGTMNSGSIGQMSSSGFQCSSESMGQFGVTDQLSNWTGATAKSQPLERVLTINKSLTSPSYILPNKVPTWDEKLQRIIKDARRGIKIAILMRGLPGSGKSTLAKQIVAECYGTAYKTEEFVLSADDIFMRNGRYIYDVSKLSEAHNLTQSRARVHFKNGVSPVIIDNTNVCAWEMKIYISLAVDQGYYVEIIEPQTPWAFKLSELAKRNTHNVPIEKIKKMLDNYEKNITAEGLFMQYNFYYKDLLPPQPRSMPPIIAKDDQQKIRGAEAVEANLIDLTDAKTHVMNNYVSLTPDMRSIDGFELLSSESCAANSSLANGHSITKNVTKNFTQQSEMMLNGQVETQQQGNFNASQSQQQLQRQQQNFTAAQTPPSSNQQHSTTFNGLEKNQQINSTVNQQGNNSTTFQNRNASTNPQGNPGITPQAEELIKKWSNLGNIDPPVLYLRPPKQSPNDDEVKDLNKTTNTTARETREVKSLASHAQELVSQATSGKPPISSSSVGSTTTEHTQTASIKVEENIKMEEDVHDAITDEETYSMDTDSSDFWSVVKPQLSFKVTSSSTTIIPKSEAKKVSREACTMTDFKLDMSEACVKLGNSEKFKSNKALVKPRDGYFDKGSMVEIVDDCVDDAVECLTRMFADIPTEYLKDVYETCKFDIQWTIDILLSDSKSLIKGYTAPAKAVKAPVKVPELQIKTNEVKKVKKDTSENALDIKRTIEAGVHISKEHYSDHLRKLKGIENEAPSTSSKETHQTPAGDVLVVDSDSDFDDSTEEVIDVSDDEMMELKLSEDTIVQLERQFGDGTSFPTSPSHTVVEVPKSLGRQLHILYLESTLKQMERHNHVLQMMIKEDEEFAMKLQEEEILRLMKQDKSETPNLRQIMQEERQRKTFDEWKGLTPDDLAYRLTKRKLIDSFPDVESDTLIEILHAHGNCYADTVEALIASGVRQVVESSVVKEPPLNDETMQEIREAHQSMQKVQVKPESTTADDLRNDAQAAYAHLNALRQKAREYSNRKMFEVAVYYSDLAHKQASVVEQINALAGEQVLLEHSSRLQKYDTVDLHYLHVREAIIALDRFLDNAIMLLRDGEQSSYVYIITGWGKHNRDGRSRIKPAVQSRLQKRGIHYSAENKGMLRAKINKNCGMSTILN